MESSDILFKFIQMNLDVSLLFIDNLIHHRMSQIYIKSFYGTSHVNARIVSGKNSYLLSFTVSLAYVVWFEKQTLLISDEKKFISRWSTLFNISSSTNSIVSNTSNILQGHLTRRITTNITNQFCRKCKDKACIFNHLQILHHNSF